MLRKAGALPAHPVIRLATRLLALTVLRPGELRGGRWIELEGLDGETPTWRIPAIWMKHMEEQAANLPHHIVPLVPAAVDAIHALRKLSGRGALMFPMASNSRRPISENAIGNLLKRARLRRPADGPWFPCDVFQHHE